MRSSTACSELLTASSWVLMTRDRQKFVALQALDLDHRWNALALPAARVWTDDHASILPYVRWERFLGKL